MLLEKEARELFKKFTITEYDVNLCHGDLITTGAGQRHMGFLLNLARKVYPRFITRWLFKNHGLFINLSLKKG